jgi:regulatory protein
MPARTPRRYDRASLWEYALRVLSGRAHSAGEMRTKLSRRAERGEDVDDVMSQLHQYGYLDDKRFAESYATARLENQQFGRARVLRELRQRRVAASTTEKSVAKVYGDVDEAALIEEWIRRKYRNAPREGLFQEDKDLASAYRRLAHAGFRSGEIIKVLKRIAKDPDRLDRFEPPEEEMEDPS